MTGKTCTIRSLLPFHQPSSFDHPEVPAIGSVDSKGWWISKVISRCIPKSFDFIPRGTHGSIKPTFLVHLTVANLLKQLATPNCFGPRIFFSIFGGPNGRMAGAAVKAEGIPVDLHAVALFNLGEQTPTMKTRED